VRGIVIVVVTVLVAVIVAVIVIMGMIMSVRGLWSSFRLKRVMLMKMEHPQQEEHRRQSPQHPQQTAIEGVRHPGFLHDHNRVRQLMQQPDAQHQAPDQTDEELQPGMGQPHQRRQHPSEPRRRHDEHAIPEEDPRCRDGRLGCRLSWRRFGGLRQAHAEKHGRDHGQRSTEAVTMCGDGRKNVCH